MKTRKPPMRSCAVTNEKYPKWDLLRVIRTPEGNVIVETDERGKTSGRGAYLKKDIEVIDKAQKTKVLSKKLEVNVPDSIYDELRKMTK